MCIAHARPNPPGSPFAAQVSVSSGAAARSSASHARPAPLTHCVPPRGGPRRVRRDTAQRRALRPRAITGSVNNAGARSCPRTRNAPASSAPHRRIGHVTYAGRFRLTGLVVDFEDAPAGSPRRSSNCPGTRGERPLRPGPPRGSTCPSARARGVRRAPKNTVLRQRT